jgi:hypothetical protein
MKKELIMTNVNEMTDSQLTQYLVETVDVPEYARKSYAAGYFEGALLSMMAQFPEVRKEMEWRAEYRRNEIEVKEYNERADARRATMEVE